MSQIRARRPRHRPLLLAAAATLTLAVSACGFDYATDQVYIASAGVDYREGDLDVLNAAVVSGQEGSGTFVATFSNNSLTETEQVVSVSAAPDDPAVTVAGFSGVDVGPTAAVSLSDEPSAVVTGEFIPGDFVSVLLDLETGDDITLSVPVVAATGFWEGLDVSSGGGETPAEEPTEEPVEPTAEPSATESEAAE